MAKTLQVNGARGEITPLMHGRIDTAFYQEGYAKATNTVITRYGPHTRVPGSFFWGYVKNIGETFAKQTKLWPFEFSATQRYTLEFGVGYLRFWLPGGARVMSGAVPYEIATPFDAGDMAVLHGIQQGDEIYLFTMGRKRIKVLRRMSETNWTITDYAPQDGPYLDVNITNTKLTLDGDNNIVPPMTSANAPEGTVTGSISNGFAAFDRDARTDARDNAANVGDIGYTIAGAPRVCNSYWLQASGFDATAMCTTWSVQGWDGAQWVTLDTRSGEAGWGRGEKRYFEFDNFTAYQQYRLKWDGTDFAEEADSRVASIAFTWAGDDMPPRTLTASDVAGINNGQGFLASDVGRFIRFQGADGQWRYMRITSWVSSTQVMVRIYGYALPDLTPIATWQLGAWSDFTGWPFTGAFYEDRLVTAGTNTDPIGVWMSVQGDYDNYRTTDPAEDDDALTLRLTGGRLDGINWLIESGTLLAGTSSALRSIGGRDRGAPLSNTNVRQRSETTVKSAKTRPENVENFVLFMDFKNNRLYETAYSYEADGYPAREVSVLNEHLFKLGVTKVAYLSHPHKYLVCLRSDGKLIFFAYDRDQKIAGGTVVDYGAIVEDICVLSGDELWLVVRRETAPGVFTRTIETMAYFFDEDLSKVDATHVPVYGSGCVVYSGAATGVIGGLNHLARRTVGVWADGRDIGDALVTDAGAIQLPLGLVATRVVVGQRMPWGIQTLRMPLAQDGTGFGQKLRIIKVTVDLLSSARFFVGGLNEQVAIADPNYIEEDPDIAEPLLTGVFDAQFDDSFANEGIVVIQGNSMHPATIRAIIIDTEGER